MGVDAFEIEVEVHAGWGEEGKVIVVGLPDTAVRESKYLLSRRMPFCGYSSLLRNFTIKASS